jgi:hypothetical protein
VVDGYELDQFKRGEQIYMNRGGFREFEDRLLIDELQSADYSRGGAYFFGSSNLKWGLKTWELSPRVRALVGNYGIGATNHRLQADFIRYLVEQRGLLQAGGEKVQVVFAGYWSEGINWSLSGYFANVWSRHGLWRYDPRVGIRTRPLNRFQRFKRTEQARLSGFISVNINRLARTLAVGLGIPIAVTERLKDPELIRRYARSSAGMTEGWETRLKKQLDALSSSINYLRARHVQVTVVLLPTREAYEELPLPKAYHEQLEALCEEKSIPFVDASRLIPEDRFWDMNHVDYEGLGILNRALMDIVRPHIDQILESGRINGSAGGNSSPYRCRCWPRRDRFRVRCLHERCSLPRNAESLVQVSLGQPIGRARHPSRGSSGL